MKKSGSFVKNGNVSLPFFEKKGGKAQKAEERQKQRQSGSGFTGCHGDGTKQNFIGGVGFGVMPAAKKP